jgi:hypothetical protein
MLLLHGAMLVAPWALLIIHARLHVNALGICAFKTLAGFDCPACGITHSIMALLNGCIQDAFRIHPAGPIIFGIVVLMTFYLGFVLLTGHRGFEWRKEAKAYGILDWMAVGVLLTGWVGRLITN